MCWLDDVQNDHGGEKVEQALSRARPVNGGYGNISICKKIIILQNLGIYLPFRPLARSTVQTAKNAKMAIANQAHLVPAPFPCSLHGQPPPTLPAQAEYTTTNSARAALNAVAGLTPAKRERARMMRGPVIAASM